MTTQSRNRKGAVPGNKGFAVLLNAMMLVFTVAVVGLAVDVGTLFMIKARLGAALDASALAAGRSLNLASTVAQAEAQATAMANQFFAANFPSGFLNTGSTPTVEPKFTQRTDASGNPNGILDIQVSASVVAPTYFMRIFDRTSVTVAAVATASRRGLVMVLVLDKSSSMNTATTPSACSAMRTAAADFITRFSPYDRIGMVTFDATAYLDYTPSRNYGDGSLAAKINAITCQSNTNTTSALELAYQQIKTQNMPLALNSIVLFTDGSPNGVSADFPVRLQVDTRWGPAAAAPPAPAQSGSTYGQSNSCASGANGGNNGICVNMPVTCVAGTTVRGTITQTSGQNSYGGSTGGLYVPISGDPAIVTPLGCNQSGSYARQMIAYIPNADLYGNSTHGLPANIAGPTVSGGLLTRDNWLFQTNQLCSPDPYVTPNCKNTGALWNTVATGSGSNLFPAGPYAGQLRNDQPNTIVAVSVNTAMSEAYRIRSDATYHVVINTIYLTGNGSDAVDREFLPVIANSPNIPALPYDPLNYTPYTNPAFQVTQQSGQYLVTADKSKLTALFAQLASEVLRLSQ